MTRILLTGASGVLGAELAAALAASGHDVSCLVHRQGEIVCNDGRALSDGPRPGGGSLRRIRGDISQPRLGLEADLFTHLVETIDLVVHSAAVTEFGHEEALYQRVNLGGAREILAFCQAGGRTALLHVSTAYVSGDRRGVIHEDDLIEHSFANAYERSKHQAERLLSAAAAEGQPIVVARPSIVVGDSRSGLTREFKNIYAVMRLGAEGRIRSIPGDFDATLDLVPLDYCVAALLGLVRCFPQAVGRRFHLVRGRPVTLRDFSDVFAEHPSFETPRFVPPGAFHVDDLSPSEARYFRRGVSLYESYFRRSMSFDDSNTRALLGDALPPIPPPKTQLRRLLNYALSVGYFGRPSIQRLRQVA